MHDGELVVNVKAIQGDMISDMNGQDANLDAITEAIDGNADRISGLFILLLFYNRTGPHSSRISRSEVNMFIWWVTVQIEQICCSI